MECIAIQPSLEERIRSAGIMSSGINEANPSPTGAQLAKARIEELETALREIRTKSGMHYRDSDEMTVALYGIEAIAKGALKDE